MTVPGSTSRQLDETLARLNREHLLVTELGDLADLLVGPDTEPFVPQRRLSVSVRLACEVVRADGSHVGPSDRIPYQTVSVINATCRKGLSACRWRR